MVSPSRTKLVVAFRGRDISEQIATHGEHIYDELFREADACLPNCKFFAERLKGLGCPPERIRVVHSGVFPEQFPFRPPAYDGQGFVRLLTVGRLVEKKGIEYAIRAVAQLREGGADARFTIVGDGPLRGELEGLAGDLGVADVVQFAGQRRQAEIADLLSKHHVFLAPSVTASDGDQDGPVNVLKEAMLTGLPVVATRHGGIPELVEEGVSGYVVPERDNEAIAEALARLLAEPERWRAMGEAGRQRVEAEFDARGITDRLEMIYYCLVGKRVMSAHTPAYRAGGPDFGRDD